MKLPAREITVKVVRLTPNFKVLKVPILKIHTYKSTIRKKKTAKKHKCVKAAQYATEQPMCHWRNQRRKKKYLEANENGNNLRNSAKTLLRGKFIAIQAYLGKQLKNVK